MALRVLGSLVLRALRMSREGSRFRRQYRAMVELKDWVRDHTHDGKTDPWELAAKRQTLEQWQADVESQRDPDLPAVRTLAPRKGT